MDDFVLDHELDLSFLNDPEEAKSPLPLSDDAEEVDELDRTPANTTTLKHSIILTMESYGCAFTTDGVMKNPDAVGMITQPFSHSRLYHGLPAAKNCTVEVVQVRRVEDLGLLERTLPTRLLCVTAVFTSVRSKQFKQRNPIAIVGGIGPVKPEELIVFRPLATEILWLTVCPYSEHDAVQSFVEIARRGFQEVIVTYVANHVNGMGQDLRTRSWMMHQLGGVQIKGYESAARLLSRICARNPESRQSRQLSMPYVTVYNGHARRQDPAYMQLRPEPASRLMGYQEVWHDNERDPVRLVPHLDASLACSLLTDNITWYIMSTAARVFASSFKKKRLDAMWFTQMHGKMLRYVLSTTAGLLPTSCCSTVSLPEDPSHDSKAFLTLPNEVNVVFLLCIPKREHEPLRQPDIERVVTMVRKTAWHGGRQVIPVFCGYARHPFFREVMDEWYRLTHTRVNIECYSAQHSAFHDTEHAMEQLSLSWVDSVPMPTLMQSTRRLTKGSVPAGWGLAHPPTVQLTDFFQRLCASPSTQYHRLMIRHSATQRGVLVRLRVDAVGGEQSRVFDIRLDSEKPDRVEWVLDVSGTKMRYPTLMQCVRELTSVISPKPFPCKLLLPHTTEFMTLSRCQLFFGGVASLCSNTDAAWFANKKNRFVGRLCLNVMQQGPQETAILQMRAVRRRSSSDNEREEEEEEDRDSISLPMLDLHVDEKSAGVAGITPPASPSGTTTGRVRPASVEVYITDARWMEVVVRNETPETERHLRKAVKNLRCMQLPIPLTIMGIESSNITWEAVKRMK